MLQIILNAKVVHIRSSLRLLTERVFVQNILKHNRKINKPLTLSTLNLYSYNTYIYTTL